MHRCALPPVPVAGTDPGAARALLRLIRLPHLRALSPPDPGTGTAHGPLRADVQAFIAHHHIDEIANDIVEVTANSLTELGPDDACWRQGSVR
ncbi:MAG: hypothetical protein Kow0073_07520 [Immundisolibacter sp.]